MSSFDNIDNEAEKTKKYGNPKRNLIITILLIILVILIIPLLSKKEIKGITVDYAVFYPETTVLYIDSQLKEDKISELNKYTNMEIKGLPDFLNRLFYYHNKNVKKLMPQAFGNAFSFGVWNDTQNVQRSLAVFSMKREGKTNALFESLLDRHEKLLSRVHNGYQINIFSKKKLAFLTVQDKLLIADSYPTLVYTIDNLLIKNSKNLYKRKNVQKLLTRLEEDRIGTVILTNSNLNFNDAYPILNNKLPISILSKYLGLFDTTVMSIMLDKDLIYFNGFTSYNDAFLKDNSIRQSVKTAFEPGKDSLNLYFIPQNTVGYLSFKNFEHFIRLTLTINGISDKQQYNEFKEFVKMLTNLDFEKDILGIFKNNLTISVINTANNKASLAGVVPNIPNTDKVISRLIKLIPMQIPSADMSKTTYQGRELGLITSPRLDQSICYGQINPNLYVFGDKGAVESIIDTIKNPKSSFSDTAFSVHAINNPQITIYINLERMKKFNVNKHQSTEEIYLHKLGDKIEAVSFTTNSKSNIIHSTLQLKLKAKSKVKGLK